MFESERLVSFVNDLSEKLFFNMAKQTRKIKLHGKYRSLQTSWQGKVVPWLNVNGVWLEQAGFSVGDQVEITVEKNQLIIKNMASNGNSRD